MTESDVPALVPSSTSATAAAASSTSRRVPLPQLAALPAETSMLYRIAAVDDRGRIAEHTIVAALGWRPPQRLRLKQLSTTTMAVWTDPGGVVSLARRGHLPLPAAARRWCALQPGDRLLLAAAPQHDLLLVHTMTALDAMVSAFHQTTHGGDAR